MKTLRLVLVLLIIPAAVHGQGLGMGRLRGHGTASGRVDGDTRIIPGRGGPAPGFRPKNARNGPAGAAESG